LEELVEDIDTRTDQIESRLPGLETRTSETERHVARLRTAVFDEKQPCPNCNRGHITLQSNVIDPIKVVCNHCDYEEKPAIR
jgi:hypothetical protein